MLFWQNFSKYLAIISWVWKIETKKNPLVKVRSTKGAGLQVDFLSNVSVFDFDDFARGGDFVNVSAGDYGLIILSKL